MQNFIICTHMTFIIRIHVSFVIGLKNILWHVDHCWVVLLISIWCYSALALIVFIHLVMFVWNDLSLLILFKLHALNILYFVSQRANYTRVDTVLETEFLCQHKCIVLLMNTYRCWLASSQLYQHLNWILFLL